MQRANCEKYTKLLKMEFVMSGEAQKKIKVKLQKAFAMPARVCLCVCVGVDVYPRDAQRTYECCEKYLQHLCNGMRCNKVHTYPNIKSNGQPRGQQEKKSGREGDASQEQWRAG